MKEVLDFLKTNKVFYLQQQMETSRMFDQWDL